MEFSPSTLGTLLIVAIVLAIAAIVIGVIAIQGERRVRATYSRFARGRREDVVTLIEMHLDEVARLRDEVRRQRAYADHLRALLGRTVSRVGTVRYDAFDDMGGRKDETVLADDHPAAKRIGHRGMQRDRRGQHLFRHRLHPFLQSLHLLQRPHGLRGLRVQKARRERQRHHAPPGKLKDSGHHRQVSAASGDFRFRRT